MQRDDDVSEFDDPALRSAIRRVWSGQTAPSELHRRLADIAGEQKSASRPAAIRANWYNHPVFKLAIAAMILVAVGLLTVKFGRAPTAAPPAVSISSDLAEDLVSRHDECCREPDHHMPGLPRDDFNAIAVVLRQRLGYPVMSGQPSTTPWKFYGASICPVGDVNSAHLVFKQAGDDISVFSLPISVDPQVAGKGPFAVMQTGHPIAGFATATALYAVVGSSTNNSLSLANVTAMCDHLRPTVVPAVAATPSVANIAW